ncbi:OsmC family protein [Herbiconiux sp. CPCC 205716]|uniref:OsmC family protein n=1 Tax=Herbiconiux gentiana TaxID=2970912 RepID=A0ABT2GEZ5_9MICO|nr:OsmC family protein [Herbiconiux gentiana]MCS5713386.1 OsmC family protein [Herbiconiux gentiana]
MNREHHYSVDVAWLGNRGTGTSGYREYGRQSVVTASGKHELEASADRTFHGDADRWNPEELLLAALAECHMLSFLHVAVKHGVVVTGYTDAARGTMEQQGDGGRFTSVTLHPVVTVTAPVDDELFRTMHREAYEVCFIASSVNFPVHHEPRLVVG